MNGSKNELHHTPNGRCHSLVLGVWMSGGGGGYPAKPKDQEMPILALLKEQERLTHDLAKTNCKLLQILEYCKPHLEIMGFATIAGIVLDCEFRDVQTKLKEIEGMK